MSCATDGCDNPKCPTLPSKTTYHWDNVGFDGPVYPMPRAYDFADNDKLIGDNIHLLGFRFTDAGRHFHVLVAIGAEAPSSAEADAYRLLDSLHFDPSVKPDWRSSD